MNDKDWKKGAFQIVRYVPDIIRGEFVNIGIILYEVETEDPRLDVRITRDWSRVLCFDPDAPIDLLENLEKTILEIRPPGRAYETIDFINEQFSTGIRLSSQLAVTGAKALLTQKTFDDELDWQMSIHVEIRDPNLEPHAKDGSS